MSIHPTAHWDEIQKVNDNFSATEQACDLGGVDVPQDLRSLCHMRLHGSCHTACLGAGWT